MSRHFPFPTLWIIFFALMRDCLLGRSQFTSILPPCCQRTFPPLATEASPPGADAVYVFSSFHRFLVGPGFRLLGDPRSLAFCFFRVFIYFQKTPVFFSYSRLTPQPSGPTSPVPVLVTAFLCFNFPSFPCFPCLLFPRLCSIFSHFTFFFLTYC